ncbi:MAG: glutathione S-transferase [Pseudomonadota bacterium]
MKLLMSPASPFVRKVRILAREAQVAIEEVAVTASPLGGEEALNIANPLGKIPALVRDSGPTLYDSRVITRYIDAQSNAQFYPEARIWETLTLEATGDGIADAAVGIIYEHRVKALEKVSHDWVEAQWQKVTRALEAIEVRWMSHLAGPMDMGHISVAAALGYLDLRHDARSWRDGRPQLAAWYAEFEARASMQETKPN